MSSSSSSKDNSSNRLWKKGTDFDSYRRLLLHGTLVLPPLLAARSRLAAVRSRRQTFFFSRTCLSTYFIKREADYKHNLMLAKQELTGTSTQRSNKHNVLSRISHFLFLSLGATNAGKNDVGVQKYTEAN